MVYDGAIPSGHAQMVHNLLDMAELTGREDYRARALQDLGAAAEAMRLYGPGMAHMQHALLRALELAPASEPAASPRAIPGPTGVITEGRAATEVLPVNAAVAPSVIDLTRGDTRATVYLQIAAGYHISGPGAAREGLTPPSLSLLDAPGVETSIRFPRALRKKYPFADRELAVYEGQLRINVTLRDSKTESSSPDMPGLATCDAPAKLLLSYQACTDNSCLQPAAVELPITLKRLQ
jgi:hypothetical protein